MFVFSAFATIPAANDLTTFISYFKSVIFISNSSSSFSKLIFNNSESKSISKEVLSIFSPLISKLYVLLLGLVICTLPFSFLLYTSSPV